MPIEAVKANEVEVWALNAIKHKSKHFHKAYLASSTGSVNFGAYMEHVHTILT